jgi:phosphatidate cytidylyltransferase
MVAVKVPFGRLIAVSITGCISLLCVFEVVRLFARRRENLMYRPVAGSVLFVLMSVPTFMAIKIGFQAVLDNSWRNALSWQWMCGAIVLAAQGLSLYLVLDGRRSLERAQHEGGRYGPAFLLVSVAAPQLVVLSSCVQGVQLLWWLTAVVALNDAAAYFVGRAVGGPKLAPAISPNKTVAGSVAGLLVGVIAGALFWPVLVGVPVSSVWLVTLSLGLTVAAQSADLSKSYLKRVRGVKDTGAIFPGHGGVLDRFDGMIGAAPLVVFGIVQLGLV